MSPERHLWIWYTPFGLGGVETYLLGITGYSTERGISTAVATTYQEKGPLQGRHREHGVDIFRWSAFHRAFMGEAPAETIRERIVSDLASFRPTLLAINDCVDFAIGAAPLLRRVRPYCTILDTFHIDAPDDGYLERRRSYLDLLDGIVGTNRHILERFRSFFGAASKGIESRYIPNGVDVPRGDQEDVDGILRLIYVGRLAQEQKRILEIPPVLTRLRDAGVRFTLTVCGEGPDRSRFEEDVNRLGLQDSVSMLGFVSPEKMPAILRRSDVFLNLSDYEGFSMSLIEAMACGCVPVISDLPSLDRELLRHRQNCILVPVDEPHHAAETLQALSRNEIRNMSAEATRTGASLTVERTWEQTAAFITDLRRKRPLEPWPEDAASALRIDWDLTRHNPWLPRPHPLRRLAWRLFGGRSG